MFYRQRAFLEVQVEVAVLISDWDDIARGASKSATTQKIATTLLIFGYIAGSRVLESGRMEEMSSKSNEGERRDRTRQHK